MRLTRRDAREPVDEALVELGPQLLRHRLVRGIADEDVREAVAVVTGSCARSVARTPCGRARRGVRRRRADVVVARARRRRRGGTCALRSQPARRRRAPGARGRRCARRAAPGSSAGSSSPHRPTLGAQRDQLLDERAGCPPQPRRRGGARRRRSPRARAAGRSGVRVPRPQPLEDERRRVRARHRPRRPCVEQVGRAVQRMRMGAAAKSDTYSTRSRNVGSAHCRSSKTTISGFSEASASSSRRTAHCVSSFPPSCPPRPTTAAMRVRDQVGGVVVDECAQRVAVTGGLAHDLRDRPVGDPLAVGSTARPRRSHDRGVLHELARESRLAIPPAPITVTRCAVPAAAASNDATSCVSSCCDRRTARPACA